MAVGVEHLQVQLANVHQGARRGCTGTVGSGQFITTKKLLVLQDGVPAHKSSVDCFQILLRPSQAFASDGAVVAVFLGLQVSTLL